MRTVTRDNQRIDVVYVCADGGFFVSPDGVGRYWFDTIGELHEQYGADHGMPFVHIDKAPKD